MIFGLKPWIPAIRRVTYDRFTVLSLKRTLYAKRFTQERSPCPFQTNFKTIHSLSVESGEICKRLVEEFPSLCLQDQTLLQKKIELLEAYGFNHYDLTTILREMPKVFDFDYSGILQTFDMLKDLKVKEEKLKYLLLDRPELFLLRPSAFKQRISELGFKFPHKDVRKLVQTCPNVFFEDWNELMNKVNYIAFEMGFDQGDIVSASALAFELNYIKTRHRLLDFCGKFKKPKTKIKNVSQNLPLKQMLKYTDEEIVDFVGVSLEEYYVLLEIVENEKDDDLSLDLDLD